MCFGEGERVISAITTRIRVTSDVKKELDHFASLLLPDFPPKPKAID